MEGSQAGSSGGHTATKLISSTLYSLEKAGKVVVGEGEGGGGESCQSLLTSENARQQLGPDMFNNGKSRVKE